MADGSLTAQLTLTLDDATLEHLRIAARMAGEAPDSYARRLLTEAVEAAYWAPALASIAEYERTGEAVSVEEAFEKVRARIAEKPAHQG